MLNLKAIKDHDMMYRIQILYQIETKKFHHNNKT